MTGGLARYIYARHSCMCLVFAPPFRLLSSSEIFDHHQSRQKPIANHHHH